MCGADGGSLRDCSSSERLQSKLCGLVRARAEPHLGRLNARTTQRHCRAKTLRDAPRVADERDRRSRARRDRARGTLRRAATARPPGPPD
jgi:hypothetical protein